MKICTSSNFPLLKTAGEGRPVLDWATRVKVAAGAARGIAYLHEDCEFLLCFFLDLSIWDSTFLDLGLFEYRHTMRNVNCYIIC